MTWMTKKKFAIERGLTMGQVEKRIARKWRRGLDFFVEEGGVTMINTDAVDKRWDDEAQAQLDQQAREYKSATPRKASANGLRLT